MAASGPAGLQQEGKQALLVIMPGAVGRRPVLERLRATVRLCALVPTADVARCAWARPLLGDDNWIECSSATAPEAVWDAVRGWLEHGAVRRRIDGVMTYDEAVYNCPHIGLVNRGVRAFRNKFEFRERCQAAGIPAVPHVVLRDAQDLEALLASKAGNLRFPCVLKPVKGAGSWHVCKVETFDDLPGIFTKLAAAMREGSFPQEVRETGFLLEEYFKGHEVDVDGWARDGRLEFLLVSDNRPAAEPYFEELGGIYPSQLPRAAVEALERLTEQVVGTFPGIHSCFHFEAKIDLESMAVMPIEFNCRCGGAECPVSVEAVTGNFLPEVAGRLALGLPIPLGTPNYSVVASTNIHVFERGVIKELSSEGLQAEACKLVGMLLFGAVGQLHVPNNGSMSCLGWMATGGLTAEEAEGNLQKALSQVRIVVAPAEAGHGEGRIPR